MCATIIAAFLILCIVALYIGGLLIGGDIIFGILFLMAIGRYISALKLRTSKMKCRNCGSTNVRLSTIVDGTDYGSTTNYWWRTRFYSGRSKIRRKRVAKCANCGFTYDYIMPEDVESERSAALGGVFIFGLIFSLFMALTVFIFTHDSTAKDEKVDATSQNVSVWSEEITPLSDFDYYVDQNEIYLKDYNGKAAAVYIPSSYKIDGAEMQVVSLDGTFTLENVTSVIISEGVRYISDNAFNSCGIKFLYMPASLTGFDGWNYFHDMDKIYYGGNEETWNQIYTDDRASLDVKQIICNATVSDIIASNN